MLWIEQRAHAAAQQALVAQVQRAHAHGGHGDEDVRHGAFVQARVLQVQPAGVQPQQRRSGGALRAPATGPRCPRACACSTGRQACSAVLKHQVEVRLQHQRGTEGDAITSV